MVSSSASEAPKRASLHVSGDEEPPSIEEQLRTLKKNAYAAWTGHDYFLRGNPEAEGYAKDAYIAADYACDDRTLSERHFQQIQTAAARAERLARETAAWAADLRRVANQAHSIRSEHTTAPGTKPPSVPPESH
jgi:hypothetical protein